MTTAFYSYPYAAWRGGHGGPGQGEQERGCGHQGGVRPPVHAGQGGLHLHDSTEASWPLHIYTTMLAEHAY